MGRLLVVVTVRGSSAVSYPAPNPHAVPPPPTGRAATTVRAIARPSANALGHLPTPRPSVLQAGGKDWHQLPLFPARRVLP